MMATVPLVLQAKPGSRVFLFIPLLHTDALDWPCLNCWPRKTITYSQYAFLYRALVMPLKCDLTLTKVWLLSQSMLVLSQALYCLDDLGIKVLIVDGVETFRVKHSIEIPPNSWLFFMENPIMCPFKFAYGFSNSENSRCTQIKL